MRFRYACLEDILPYLFADNICVPADNYGRFISSRTFGCDSTIKECHELFTVVLIIAIFSQPPYKHSVTAFESSLYRKIKMKKARRY